MDQTSRYVDLSLQEADLIAAGKHVLCAYRMKPKAGYSYLATAAHFAAESSTGTNVEVSTTDDFTRSVDAIVYEADEDQELMKIAYPLVLFDRNVTDGRAMIVSFLTLTIGNNQGMGDVEYAKMHDFYVPPDYLRLFDGPAKNIVDFWRILRRQLTDGGMVVGTIIKPKLGLRPQLFADACYSFWLSGDFVKNDEPQGNQPFAPYRETMRLVADAMRRAQDETGKAKLFSANITADDPFEMIARGELVLETFAENADHVAFLVDGYVGGPAAVTTARRRFANQFLHYHRAGHGAVTSAQSKRGYTAFVLSKMARLQGASGIHTGTMGFGKMEGDPADRMIAYMIERDAADGPFFHQEWLGMKATTPMISGGMNALRLPGFFDNLGHANVVQTSGGGTFGHLDGPVAGAASLRQSVEAWQAGVDLVTYAKEHKELARAFASFPGDADALYPGWRETLAVG
ncbi:MAG TPA: ribulose-bisphosphate carboxylase [Thermoleophilia bacterium]|nr:ribulose-bisphosphate carboxylase [Thermoleophilia bacterium]